MQKRDYEKENNIIFKWIGNSIALIILIVFLFSEPWRCRGCFLNENSIYEEEFKGIVIKKIIDYPNHAVESLILTNNNKVSLLRGNYYNHIMVGDSISKLAYSFKLEILKKDTLIELSYKLPCKEKGYLYY